MPCQPPLLTQVLSFAGALLILIAYAGHQLGLVNPRSAAYNILNAAGSAILGYIAFKPFQLGFVVLECTWVLISIWALFQHRRQSAGSQKA